MTDIDTEVGPKKRHSSKRVSRHKSNPSEKTTELPPEFISRSASKEKKKRRSLVLPPVSSENKDTAMCPPISKDTLQMIHKQRSASLSGPFSMSTSTSSTESLRSSSMMDITPPYSPGKLQVGSGSRDVIITNETKSRPTFHRNKQNEPISSHRTEIKSRENSGESHGKPNFVSLSDGSDSISNSTNTSRSYLRKAPESVTHSEYKDGLLCLNTIPFDDVTFCFICEKDFTADLSYENDSTSISSQLVSKDLLKKVIVITGYKMDPMPVYRQIYVCSDCHENIQRKEDESSILFLSASKDVFQIVQQKKCVICSRAKVYFS